MRTLLLLAGGSLIGLAGSAAAQTSTVEAASNVSTNAPDAATDADQSSAADIVVTASKREERLQDVPVAVTVVGGNQLTQQNVVGVTELTRSTPSLNISGFQGALSIRGIGGQTFSRASESSVGVVVDGVALGNASQFPPPIFDAARVEVLNGPQGTLFGRAASAGVLSIVTNAPDPTRTEVIAHADIATRNNYIVRTIVNLPVADNAALRVTGVFSQAPETIRNRFDGTQLRNRTTGGRARFKWDATDRITINLIGDYGVNTQRGGAAWVPIATTAGSALTKRLTACGVQPRFRNQEACIDGGNDLKTEAYGFSGQADIDFDGITLSSISAYRAGFQFGPLADSDSSPVNRLNTNTTKQAVRNFSQEFRLTSPSGSRIEYTAGLYFFDSALDGYNRQLGQVLADYPSLGFCPIGALALCNLSLGGTREFHVNQTSTAAYVQSTVRVSDAFRVILGGRLNREAISSFSPARISTGGVAALGSLLTVAAGTSDWDFSYRGGVQLDLSRDVMAYATYTRGYKGPAINDATPVANYTAIVQPEYPHNAEVGVKATLLDGRLAFNVSGYRNVVTQFQAQFFDPTVPAYVYGNAPRLKAQGVQVDVFGAPVSGLTLNVGALYNDARYGAGYNIACYQSQTAAQGCTSGVTGTTGNQLAGAPRWKVTGNFQYVAPLAGRMEAFVGGDVIYTSRIFSSATNDPGTTIPAAAIFSGRVGVRTQDQRYGLSLFGRNLFDTYRPVFIFGTPLAAQQLDARAYSATPGPDGRRVIGLSLDARF